MRKARQLPKTTGALLGVFIRYRSTIDGAPCIAVINRARANRKIAKRGEIALQVWYLRADQSPVQASKAGVDASICGACPRRHSLEGDCYVTIFRAPYSVYSAFERGRYSEIKRSKPTKAQLGFLRSANYLRLGSYGDPLSAPLSVSYRIFTYTGLYGSHTGYTHLWRQAKPDARFFLMASVDTRAEQQEARLLGWSSFLATDKVAKGAIHCPAQRTNGKISCSVCLACDGARDRQREIEIVEHGQLSTTKHKRAANFAA